VQAGAFYMSEDNFFEQCICSSKTNSVWQSDLLWRYQSTIGAGRSARMVGYAMNASHTIDDVPAHRVVNRKGLLTGKFHFDGTNLMQLSEGIMVVDNQIINFETFLATRNRIEIIFYAFFSIN
jgi:methylated-DNA-protein-cysteine methyltransferase-like protein